MTGLLVSVRSVPEARAALAGGAALIDVKEPDRGALGRADDETIAAVVGQVAGSRPVSAALGDMLETPAPLAVRGLAYVKWGLAGCADRPDWRQRLAQLKEAMPGSGLVAVAYADHRRAQAPRPDQVVAFAREAACPVVLFDTFIKDGSTLLDWIPAPEVGRLCHRCREVGIRIALAGSLGVAEIRILLPAGPDWFAVRGGVCRGDCRTGPVDAVKVRRLVDLVGRRGG